MIDIVMEYWVECLLLLFKENDCKGNWGCKNDEYFFNKHTRTLNMIKGVIRGLLTFLFPFVILGLDVKVSV